MKTIVVIPTYNEAENIGLLVEKILALPLALEIIFVDDHSPDDTGDIIKKIINTKPVQLIERPGKLGLGSAYIEGFKAALAQNPDFIIQMDADLSHDPNDIPSLIAACEEISIGSRRIPGGKIVGWNFQRKLMSAGAMWFARIILGLKTKDVTAGFRCFKSEALRKLKIEDIKSNGYAFQEEVIFRAERWHLKIKEVPTTFHDRKAGKSKLSQKDILEFFKTIFRLKTTKLKESVKQTG